MATGSDIFTGAQYNNQTLKGYRLGQTILTIGSSNYRLVAQQFRFTYQQQVDIVSPVNADQRILVAGEPQGQADISILIGPSENVKAFLTEFSDVCKLSDASKNYITLEPKNNCTNTQNENVRYTLGGCLINSIAGQISRTNGGNVVISTIGMTFLRLSVD